MSRLSAWRCPPESKPTFQRLVSLLEADGYCGQCTKLLYDGTANFEQSVLPTVSASLQPGDAVLLKSSRDAGLRRIAGPLVEHLARRDGSAGTTQNGDQQ